MLKLKTIATLMLLGVVTLTTSAQEQKTAKKPRVLVENFTTANHVNEDISNMVRQEVIDGLNKTQRFEIVDETKKGTGGVSTDADASQDYIIKGDVLLCSVTEKVKDGKRQYYCDMSYSVTVIETATSSTVATKKFEHSGGGLLTSASETADKARTSSLTLIDSDMKDFLINEFPLEGTLLTMDYEVKKDKITTCYIEIGSDVGVKEKDYFVIMVPKVRAGRSTYSEVGKLRVTEVVDGTLSFCKITSKGKEVLEALNAYMSLDEETRAKQPIKVKSTEAPLLSF